MRKTPPRSPIGTLKQGAKKAGTASRPTRPVARQKGKGTNVGIAITPVQTGLTVGRAAKLYEEYIRGHWTPAPEQLGGVTDLLTEKQMREIIESVHGKNAPNAPPRKKSPYESP